MFARVTTSQVAADKVQDIIDSGEKIMAPLAAQTGFKGYYALIDRQSGKIMSITLWETEEALQASQFASSQVRTQATQAFAAIAPTVEQYEVGLHSVK